MTKIISQYKKTLYHYTTLEAAVKILRYQIALGNKELVGIKENIVYPIMEKDYQLDI